MEKLKDKLSNILTMIVIGFIIITLALPYLAIFKLSLRYLISGTY